MGKWDLIISQCPKLYRNAMYFECGVGWADLIHKLSLQIEEALERNAWKLEGDVYFEMFADQVKEKYGTLRFYMNFQTKEIEDLIEEAEDLSTKVCEDCGSPGKIRGDSWITVRCDDCYKK